MRKNSPRKWLHAILDLLPVILIPVFMIYSHRHTIDSYSVTRQERENQPYNFYQGVVNGKPDNLTGWYSNADDIFLSTTYYNEKSIYVVSEENTFNFTTDLNINIQNQDLFYLTLDFIPDTPSYELTFSIYGTTENVDDFYTWNGNNTNKISFIYESEYTDTFNSLYVYDNDEISGAHILNLQIFNLTNIFGSGNEPTKEEFESMLTQDYYNYGNNYVDNYVTISKTYNDTDIMSQFTYNLYNSVDKYFNMNNVFGMNNVYSWFETNIFHGTAPLYIYIVWNILLYEFVMDLLMLLYALFMWFIDMCQNLIERTYCSSKGGK